MSSSGRTSAVPAQRPPIAVWNPVRDVWETGQTDLFSGLSDVWSETWPASGMTRRGSLYGLPTSEPRTAGSGSSSSRGVPTLPTPSASCATGPGEHGDGGMNLQTVAASLLT